MNEQHLIPCQTAYEETPPKHHPFSPSTLQRLSMCPGSWRMSKDIPEPPSSPDAAEGTRLHEAVATGKIDDLDAEQQAAVTACLDFIETLKRPGDIILTEYHVTVRDEDGEILTEGVLDFAAIHEDKTADTVDFKFGRTPVPSADKNYQGAGYSLALFQEFGLTAVKSHFFQPRIFNHTDYLFRDPAAILHNIKFIINRAKSETIILSASDEACRYCRAASTCPACNARYGLVPADIQQNMLSDPAKLLDLWERAQMASKLVDAIKQAVTDYINEHGSLGDWTLEQRAGRREFNDNTAVLEKARKIVSESELAKCYTISVTSVIDKMADYFVSDAKSRGEKWLKKDAKKHAEAILADYIVRKDGSAVLTKGAKKA